MHGGAMVGMVDAPLHPNARGALGTEDGVALRFDVVHRWQYRLASRALSLDAPHLRLPCAQGLRRRRGRRARLPRRGTLLRRDRSTGLLCRSRLAWGEGRAVAADFPDRRAFQHLEVGRSGCETWHIKDQGCHERLRHSRWPHLWAPGTRSLRVRAPRLLGALAWGPCLMRGIGAALGAALRSMAHAAPLDCAKGLGRRRHRCGAHRGVTLCDAPSQLGHSVGRRPLQGPSSTRALPFGIAA
mmetsp:Transcript_39798/g.114412  ORF Transcript_39798/g.114412 Transcript_39798/m.114412 type:complete len:242 (+) Transcript_39798:3405-4130(+)